MSNEKTDFINKSLLKINSTDIVNIVDKKLDFFNDIIQKTILHVKKNKVLDILGITEVESCIFRLTELNKKIKELIYLNNNNSNTELLINNLQIINNELSSLFFSSKNVLLKLLPIGNKFFGLNKFKVRAISEGLSNIGVADNKKTFNESSVLFIIEFNVL